MFTGIYFPQDPVIIITDRKIDLVTNCQFTESDTEYWNREHENGYRHEDSMSSHEVIDLVPCIATIFSRIFFNKY